jgi:hypothetical protein
MQLILILLAISCSALAIPTDTLPNVQEVKESCPGKCLFTEKYRGWFQQVVPKAQQLGKQIQEGGYSAAGILPPVETEKLTQACTELSAVETCINACAEDEKKTKAKAILVALRDIVCDETNRAKLPCLQEVAKTKSEACNNQCQPLAQPIVAAYEQYKAQGAPQTRDWSKAKEIGTAVCKFVNCRYKCRKPDIETKCQAEGAAAAKAYLEKLAKLGQTVHAQFRPAENFPDECKPEQITA